jgi:hypothetical protein
VPDVGKSSKRRLCNGYPELYMGAYFLLDFSQPSNASHPYSCGNYFPEEVVGDFLLTNTVRKDTNINLFKVVKYSSGQSYLFIYYPRLSGIFNGKNYS